MNFENEEGEPSDAPPASFGQVGGLGQMAVGDRSRSHEQKEHDKHESDLSHCNSISDFRGGVRRQSRKVPRPERHRKVHSPLF